MLSDLLYAPIKEKTSVIRACMQGGYRHRNRKPFFIVRPWCLTITEQIGIYKLNYFIILCLCKYIFLNNQYPDIKLIKDNESNAYLSFLEALVNCMWNDRLLLLSVQETQLYIILNTKIFCQMFFGSNVVNTWSYYNLLTFLPDVSLLGKQLTLVVSNTNS